MMLRADQLLVHLHRVVLLSLHSLSIDSESVRMPKLIWPHESYKCVRILTLNINAQYLFTAH